MNGLNLFVDLQWGAGRRGKNHPAHASFTEATPWAFSCSAAILELTLSGARSNCPATEVKALPPQLLNLTNYTWVYSNMKKCVLCSWPLGQHRDQIPGHRKALLIFIKSHGRPALHFCFKRGTRCSHRQTIRLLCWGQSTAGIFFFFLLFAAWLLIN